MVVWRKDLYLLEGQRQLSDRNTYMPPPSDPTCDDLKVVKNTIKELVEHKDLPSTGTNLIPTEPRCPRFYMLPKIHKEGTPGRPIVSTCNCPTLLISEQLETILSPLVTRLPTYIKDTNDAIRTFKQFEFAGQHRHLFTMDVTALYTSIPIKDSLQALQYFLNQHNTSGFSTTSIVRLAELVLNNASFEFNGAYFRQISGY